MSEPQTLFEKCAIYVALAIHFILSGVYWILGCVHYATKYIAEKTKRFAPQDRTMQKYVDAVSRTGREIPNRHNYYIGELDPASLYRKDAKEP